MRAMVLHPTGLRGVLLRGSGPVAEFESLLCRRTGYLHAMATCNATSAVMALAIAAGWKGRRVIVAGGKWRGTAEALRLCGVDTICIRGRGWSLPSPRRIARWNRTAVAAIIVSSQEIPRDSLPKWRSICDLRSCLLVEDSSFLPDAAEASFPLPDCQVISFGPGKPLSLGEGGALLSKDAALVERCVKFSQHPERYGGRAESARAISMNARIHPIAAALGVAIMTDGMTLPAANCAVM